MTGRAAEVVPDLLDIEEPGKQHGLAAMQARCDFTRISERHDSAEVFDKGSLVGGGPLMGLNAISSNKQDVLQLYFVLAVTQRPRYRGQGICRAHVLYLSKRDQYGYLEFCLVIVTPGCRRTFSTLPALLRKTAERSS